MGDLDFDFAWNKLTTGGVRQSGYVEISFIRGPNETSFVEIRTRLRGLSLFSMNCK